KGKGKQKPKPKPKPKDEIQQRIRETVSKNPVRHTLGALPTVVGFLFMLPVFVKRLCDELTTGAKELMSINGLSEMAFWMGCSIGAFFEMFLVQAPLIVLLRSNPLTGAVGLWPHSDVTVLVMFFTVYSAAATCFAIVIAIISPRPNIAAILTFVIMVMTLIPAIIMIVATGASLKDSERDFTANDYAYRAILLIPNIGFTYGITLICESEELGTGIRLRTFTKHQSFHKLTLADICKALLISCGVSMGFAWYLKNVWPLGYSFPKPWWFILLPSYWGVFRGVGITADQAKTIQEDPLLYEPVSENLESTIVIYKLSKTFGPVFCRTVILKDITLKIFQGHITAVLGRNGAGKSTLLRTIIGSIQPSSGTVFVQGQDIRKKKAAVRKDVGYCPQHFSLYREMTVEENLWLFGRIRGMNNKETDDALTLILMSFQINDIKDKLVKRLTTGQKRKVQLGISLVGDPQVRLLLLLSIDRLDTHKKKLIYDNQSKTFIRSEFGVLLIFTGLGDGIPRSHTLGFVAKDKMLLLDEPTVGCDTESRNALWHSILKIRGQRGILLATNSIEEADILGDRVAIISTGVVRCCGSALFLRKKYGIGYRLHMTTTEMPNVKHLVSFVTAIVEGARVFLERRGYIIFSLGNPEHVTLIELLKQIEQSRRSLGVFTLGLAATSLEDVLLKYDRTWIYDRDFVPVTGFALLVLQTKALLYKKISYYKRSYWSIPTLIFFIFVLVVFRSIAFGLLPWQGVKNLDLNEMPARVITANLGQVINKMDNQSGITYSIEMVEDTVTGPMFTTALTARIMDSLILPLLLSLLAAAYIVLPIEETVSKAKMLQLMTGISATRFWFINFIIDFVTYNFACIAAFLPLYVGDPNQLHGRDPRIISRYYSLFALFGWSFIPTTYVTSFFVETATVAYFALIVESFITGTVTSIVLFLFAKDLVIKQVEQGNYHKLITKLEFPMRIVPNFAVNRGFGAINRELISQLICCNFPLDLQKFLCRHSKGDHSHVIFSLNETVYWDRLTKSCPS
ncbi:unnamed protein product, partial [Ixodes hexagonus]